MTNLLFNLFKIEIKNKYKVFAIWTVVWSLMAVLMSGLFASLNKEENINDLLSIFPEEMLTAFGIQDDYFTNPESFFVGEFFSIFALGIAIYAFILGFRAVGQRINNKTIANYINKPISRKNLLHPVLFSNLFLFVITNTLLALAIYSAASFFNNYELSVGYLLSFFGGAFLLSLPFLSLGFLAGIVLPKIAQTLGVSIIVVMWFLNTISNLQGYPDWAKYLSFFYYIKPEEILNHQIGWENILILIISGLVLYLISVEIFKKRDIFV